MSSWFVCNSQASAKDLEEDLEYISMALSIYAKST